MLFEQCLKRFVQRNRSSSVEQHQHQQEDAKQQGLTYSLPHATAQFQQQHQQGESDTARFSATPCDDSCASTETSEFLLSEAGEQPAAAAPVVIWKHVPCDIASSKPSRPCLKRVQSDKWSRLSCASSSASFTVTTTCASSASFSDFSSELSSHSLPSPPVMIGPPQSGRFPPPLTRSGISRNFSKSAVEALGDLNELDGECDEDYFVGPASAGPLNRLGRSVSCPTVTSNKTIRFSVAHIYEHPVILGDNPACAHGPPLTIDWTPSDCRSIRIEDIEDANKFRVRRSTSDLVVPKYLRVKTLKSLGYTRKDLRKTKNEIRSIQNSRADAADEFIDRLQILGVGALPTLEEVEIRAHEMARALELEREESRRFGGSAMTA